MRRLAWGACFAGLAWALSCGGEDAPRPVPTGRYASKSSALSTGTGLQGDYFDTIDFSQLKTTRIDPTINFDWGSGAITGTALTDQYTFSVRWTGQVETPVTGTYTFTVGSDDGCRLWVNGQLLVADWTLHSYKENSATISLTAGQRYDIKLEYYENLGVASAKLFWSYPGQAQQIIPTTRLYPPLGPPVLVAPALDLTVPTSMPDATEFIYSGPNAVQIGVDAGTIDKGRVALIRGRVVGADGSPIQTIVVSVLNHPEYGQTLSRADGWYDFALNGGGPMTLQFLKDGFLPVHRLAPTRWRDFVVLDDVVMTSLDPAITVLSSDAGTAQVARGTVVQDDAGTRQATLVMPPGTMASMVLPDGGVQPLPTLHFRATEYTVGDNGPRAMPATLPARTAYTYAIELSADEALAAGATSVQFSQAVSVYLDNFLGFPVGANVPSGYYDRAAGAWRAEADGRVVRVLGVSGGLAQLDVDGTGQPASQAALNSLGIGNAERQALASVYPTGTPSLWRVQATHFTPSDYNWSFLAPPDAIFPTQGPDSPEDDPDGSCTSGSIIECENSVLGEEIPISGTDLSLAYRSDRVIGRTASYSLTIPVVPKNVPASLAAYSVEVSGAGRKFSWGFTRNNVPVSGTVVFVWDGKDGYGRDVNGKQLFKVRVGYGYGADYTGSSGGGAGRSFGTATGTRSGVVVSSSRTVFLYTDWDATLGGLRYIATGFGGWGLSELHAFDRQNGVVFRGDGSRSSAVSSSSVVSALVGGGVAVPTEGGPAVGTNLPIGGLAAAPDGSVVVVKAAASGQLWRVRTNGTLTLVAGTGVYTPNQPPLAGDGQPATTVSLGSVTAVAVGPDGSVYFSQPQTHTVRRVSPDGTLSTIAGTGTSGSTGNGGPATAATLMTPSAVGLDKEGNLYIGDSGAYQIRRVDVGGTVSAFAGNGQYQGGTSDGLAATQTAIGDIKYLAVGPDGAVYTDNSAGRVWKFDSSGVAQVVVGPVPPINSLNGSTPDGVAARGAAMGQLQGLGVTPEGRLLVADSANARLRMVDSAGLLATAAGNGNCCAPVPGQSALGTTLMPMQLATGPDGALFVAQTSPSAGYRIAPALVGYSVTDSVVGSPDASEAYVFDGKGRHLRTLDAFTGALKRQFNYDSNGLLASIVDGSGNTTTFQRGGAGAITGIDAPFGQHTSLTTDSNGYLSSVSNPASETIGLSMDSGGLLRSLTDAKQQTHTFEYDSSGRLTKDNHPSGGSKRLDRTRNGSQLLEVDVTTALGRKTGHLVQYPGSSYQKRTLIRPDGTQDVTTEVGSVYRSTQAANGALQTVTFGADGRFGVSAQVPSWTFRSPAGLSATGSVSRTATLTNSADPLSLQTLTETNSRNGTNWTRTYAASTRTWTLRSPFGRTSTVVLDAQGRVSKTTVPGLADVNYAYDTRGRLQSIQQGTRTVSWTFGADGLPATSTDALSRVTTYLRDLVGRVKVAQLPASREVDFDYDLNGNASSVTPPGQPAHGFTFSPRDDVASYVPPAVSSPPASPIGTRSTAYGYDLDGALTGVSLPDSTSITPTYDAYGRLDTVQTARTIVQMHYSPDAGQLTSITDALASGATPTASNVAYAYDGPIITATTWSGAVNGSIGYTYNTDFNVVTTVVPGTPLVTNGYDTDLLLTSVKVDAGTPNTLTLSRSSQNGLLSGTTLGTLTTSQTYDSYGALATLSASAGSTSLYSATLTPDGAGRIHQKVESVQGVFHTYVYAYDNADRLTDVTVDGTAAGHWTYDANGNRLTGTPVGAPGTTLNGTYDAQDRLISYGNNTYAFGPNGDLQSKTTGGQTTTYAYDALGALSQVTLPNGDRIDYVLDAVGRRVGKKLNGTLQRGWLYEGIRPIAEVDGTGTVVARFVYGTRPHVPDMMWKAGVLYRYVTDERGSVRLVVNASTGAVVHRLDYDVWGNVTADSAPGFQPFGYAGGLWETSTKLVRFGARDYDPETGRWTSKDPARFAGGLNFFAYAENNPVDLVDPSGLCPGLLFGGPGAAEAAAIDALSFILPSSSLHRVEYGGSICKRSDEKVFATNPNAGTGGMVFLSQCPEGTTTLGYYHTHPNDADRNNRFYPFSDDDVGNCRGYTACWLQRVPDGGFWRWDPGLNFQRELFRAPLPGQDNWYD